jgi:hypothetical protein
MKMIWMEAVLTYFAWRDCEKPCRTSVKIAGLREEI